MTVVQYEQPPPLPASAPGDELHEGPTGDVARLRMAAEYAGYIADTEFVPHDLRGRPAAIAAAIMAGTELGLKPMAALRTVAIIKGRPSATAEALRGLVTSNGHEIWIEESTVTRCIAAGRRAGSERIGRVIWTLDDAKRAGIAGQSNWRNYPAAMLVARATAALARQMFADVTLGIPATEELEDEPENGPPLAPPQPPPADVPHPPATTRTRRRKPASKPSTGAATGPAATPASAPLPPTPPPDEQPEPPPAPDPASEPAATDAQKRQIFALMRDVGLTGSTDADRDHRLAYTSRVAGRTIGSSNDLTVREAGLVIEDLQQVALLPAGEDRQRRLLGATELAALQEAEQVAAETDGGPEPVPFNELLEGF